MTTNETGIIFNSMVRKNKGNPDFVLRNIGLRGRWISYSEADFDKTGHRIAYSGVICWPGFYPVPRFNGFCHRFLVILIYMIGKNKMILKPRGFLMTTDKAGGYF